MRYALSMKPRQVLPGHFAIAGDDLNDRINRLPLWARRYIHELETRADPSGDIRDLAELRDQREGLVKVMAQLKRENAALRRRLARR
jgi:hypothetical protein